MLYVLLVLLYTQDSNKLNVNPIAYNCHLLCMMHTFVLNLVLLHVLVLGIDELINVIQHLEDARFDKTKWKKLGGTLGLHINTLNMINKNESGDIEDCFRECLGEWLKRVDNVDKVGKPSLDTLADALDKMNGCKDQAEYISKCITKTTSVYLIITTLLNQALLVTIYCNGKSVGTVTL